MGLIKTIIKWAAFLLLGILILGAFVGSKDLEKAKNSDSENASTPAPELTTSANELAKAYDNNTVAADSKYKGKVFEVTGTVTDINTDIFNNAVIILKGGVNQFMDPHFTLADEHKSLAGSLSKGDQVTLICKGKGDLAKTPMSDDCLFKK